MTALMTTSRTALGGLLALAVLPAFWPSDAMAAICPETEDTQLTADQSTDAGDVKLCNDGTTLTITYEATFPWCLLETDLHVATVPDPADPDGNIPQTKSGNPTSSPTATSTAAAWLTPPPSRSRSTRPTAG